MHLLSAARLGAAVMCLVFYTICVPAAPAPDPRSSLLTALTNALQGNPATLSPTATSTNDSRSSTLPGRAAHAPTGASPAATKASQPNITNDMEALDDKHTLAIGDILSFRIVEDQEDPKVLTVTDSGDLEVPYIGRFPAENRTCKQLARELKTALEKEYYYQATVIVAVNSMTKSRGKVYLVGPVRMPGPQELPSDEVLTASKAILRAGGFNDYADRKHVKITREGDAGKSDKVTLVVDVGQIFDEGKTEKDVALKPGDLIYIPDRLVRF